MATTNLSIQYRPVRIGFLVREGEIGDLVKAAGINTLLWGGIYNPVLPVGDDGSFAERLIEVFAIDVLYAVGRNEQIGALLAKHRFLKDPHHIAENIFYEDWHTKRNLVGYLDSGNIVDFYWERDFRHKPKRFKSGCALVRWSNEDQLKNLFSICFGQFPTEYNLRDDFQTAFLKGLRSKEIPLQPDTEIPAELSQMFTPLRLTAAELHGYGGSFHGNGIYVGDEADFTDLVYFWNLRASGLAIEFLSKGHLGQFEKFIKAHLKRLDASPNKHPNIEDWIEVYFRGERNQELTELADSLQTKKRKMLHCCEEVIWNGLNIKPKSHSFSRDLVLANVDKSYLRYHVAVNLPEKKFLAEPDDTSRGFQNLVVTIDPLTEFEYPEYTLKLPLLRQLNEFYSRETVIDPFKARIENDRIGIIEQVHDTSLSLFPVSHQSLIERVFDLAGIKVEMSQPGLLTKRILEKLGGVDGGRVFKICGVRSLLQELKAEDSIDRGEAKNKIWADGEFRKYEELFIEARDSKKLTTDHVFDFLLKKDLFRAGLELRCDHCKLASWLSLRELDDSWTCNFCGDQNKTSLHLRNRGDWKFRKSGLFAKDNNQEGAIPVILTLLVFFRILDASKFIHSSSLNLNIGTNTCEIDFCVLQYQRGDRIELGFGECKSRGGKISAEDIENLKLVRNKFEKTKIDCYLVFSKTADQFDDEEIQLFKTLRRDRIPVVLLTNKELEPYNPYWGEDSKVPHKYALTLSEMAQNSEYIYLNPVQAVEVRKA